MCQYLHHFVELYKKILNVKTQALTFQNVICQRRLNACGLSICTYYRQ